MDQNKTTVYSCSGCSNVAQLANRIAVHLDRQKLAKMSCIAGVGASVPSLVNVAKNASKIVVIDGCPIECAKKCLNNQNIYNFEHLVLTDLNLKKNSSSDATEDEFLMTLAEVKKRI